MKHWLSFLIFLWEGGEKAFTGGKLLEHETFAQFLSFPMHELVNELVLFYYNLLPSEVYF